MQNCVIYVRVSSREQEREGFSIPAQIELLQDYARKKNMKVVRVFQEAETAKKSGRTEFNAMLAFLKKSQNTNIILVEKTDRLYRNFKDYVTIDDADVEIHLVKEGVILSKDSRSHEKFMHGIKVLMAKNYTDNLSEEVKKGHLERANQGYLNGRAPYGYTNNRLTRQIDVDEKAAPFVRRAFELYATGQYTLKQVSNQLKHDGFVYKSYRTKIGVPNLDVMLKNVTYTGDFMMKGIFYEGKHEAIVSKELFQACKNVREGKIHPKSNKHQFAFANMISCAHCGCTVGGQIQKGKYIYYHCAQGKGKCEGAKYVREEVLIEQFARAIERISFDAQHLEWMIQALRESHKDEIAFHKKRVEALQAEYKRLEGRIEQLYEDKLDGVITHQFWEKKQNAYKQDMRDVETSLAQHRKGNMAYIETGVMLLELAKNAYPLYKRQTPSEQRRLLSFVLSNCCLEGANLRYTYKRPFDYLAKCTEMKKKLTLLDQFRTYVRENHTVLTILLNDLTQHVKGFCHAQTIHHT